MEGRCLFVITVLSTANTYARSNTYWGYSDHNHLNYQNKAIRPAKEVRLRLESSGEDKGESKEGKRRDTEEKRCKFTRIAPEGVSAEGALGSSRYTRSWPGGILRD